MTIQPIGAASVALYLTPEDLREYGATPEDLTEDLALELTRHAFRQAGLPLDGALEIEAYPDLCGVLVFARRTEPKQFWFTFDGLEELLCAARCVGPCPDATLIFWEDRYWLSVPGDQPQCACRLSEFGASAQPGPTTEAQLAEHGVILFAVGALAALLKYFPD